MIEFFNPSDAPAARRVLARHAGGGPRLRLGVPTTARVAFACIALAP